VTFSYFSDCPLQVRVDDAPLDRRVLVIGGRQLRDDVDRATGDLELDSMCVSNHGLPDGRFGHGEVALGSGDYGPIWRNSRCTLKSIG
jgi:hypothetical protein